MFNASSFSLSSSSRKSSWGSDKTQEDTKESEITPAVKLNFSIAQKQQKDTIVIPKRSERRKSDTSTRNISAPVSNPLLEEDSSTVDDQSNIRSTSFSRKPSVRARRGHRKRPQSMFIERRLSSLFNPAGSNESHQDQNDYPHHHHHHHHHRLSVQRYDNEDQPKASSFHPHRRVSSLASDKENRLMNEDATDGSLRKTKSKFFGWFQRQSLSLSWLNLYLALTLVLIAFFLFIPERSLSFVYLYAFTYSYVYAFFFSFNILVFTYIQMVIYYFGFK